MAKKPTYEELEEQVASYQSLMESISGMVYVAQPDWTTSVCTRSERISGYASEEFNSGRINWPELVHQDDRKRVIDQSQQLPEKGNSLSQQYRIRTKDDEIKWVLDTKVARFDSGGQFAGVDGFVIDISGKKKAEEEMQRIKVAVDSTTDAIGMCTRDGLHFYQNAAFTELFGYTKEEVRELHPAHLYVDKDIATEIFSVIMKGGSWQGDIEMIAKSGRKLQISLRGDAIKDDQGEIIGLIGVHTDITGRKEAEQNLLAQKHFISAIAETSPAIIYVYDLEKNCNVYTNSGVERLFGYSVQEIQEKGDAVLADLLHPEDQSKILKLHARLSNSQDDDIFTVQYRMKHRDGSWKYLHSYERVFLRGEDGRVKQKIGVAVDTTEKMVMENSLKESEEKYRHLIETASDAVYLIAEDGNVIDVNRAACQTLGRTKEEILHLNISGVDPNFSREAFLEYWKTTPLNSPRLFETSHLHSDGSLVPVEVSGQKFKVGEDIVFFGIARDITERIKAQAEHDELQARFMQSQKMESIGNLAGGIAHEFNNMLAIIIGNNEIIMDESPGSGIIRDSAEDIRVAGLRAKDVVKQLLTFSRRDNAVQKRLNLYEEISESIKLIRSSTPANIEIVSELAEDVAPVVGNSTQINQLLINLCNNAVDAVPDEGGLVSIELSGVTVGSSAHQLSPELAAGKYVKLVVSDNGMGLEEGLIDRIFEPYFTTKEVGKGTGIGLAVVHGIVERHGGRILTESKSGEGTTFSVYLPAREGDSETEKEERSTLPRGVERILFVDDEESLVKLSQRLLGSLGYEVVATTDPLKAFTMVKEEPDGFKLLITDMAMPGMTGDRLIAKVQEIRPELPTIICTGFSEKISESEALEAGVNAFIMKPVDKTELAQTVRRVLDEVSR